MAVFFRSSDSTSSNNLEVDEYQEFPRPEPEDAPTETPKPKLRHISAVLLSFGLLCVLQGILNISLRLALTAPTDKGETEISVCPEGWITFSSSCYYISSQKRSWDDSRQDCMQREADLVIITSRQEQAFLTGFTAAAWVGMTDRKREGTWVWVDGTPLDEDMLQWANGQPDGAFGGEDCGELRTMSNFIGLNDFNCSHRIRWICEKALL